MAATWKDLAGMGSIALMHRDAASHSPRVLVVLDLLVNSRPRYVASREASTESVRRWSVPVAVVGEGEANQKRIGKGAVGPEWLVVGEYEARG
jgi:hypothetical protein